MSKTLTRETLFSTLISFADDDYQQGNKYSGEPVSIWLMDSNDNVNQDIKINELTNDDELQLVCKFFSTDVDEAHNWVEELLTQLKLENNCEIIDDDTDVNQVCNENEILITTVFVLEDFPCESETKSNSVVPSSTSMSMSARTTTTAATEVEAEIDINEKIVHASNASNASSIDETMSLETNESENEIESESEMNISSNNDDFNEDLIINEIINDSIDENEDESENEVENEDGNENEVESESENENLIDNAEDALKSALESSNLDLAQINLQLNQQRENESENENESESVDENENKDENENEEVDAEIVKQMKKDMSRINPNIYLYTNTNQNTNTDTDEEKIIAETIEITSDENKDDQSNNQIVIGAENKIIITQVSPASTSVSAAPVSSPVSLSTSASTPVMPISTPLPVQTSSTSKKQTTKNKNKSVISGAKTIQQQVTLANSTLNNNAGQSLIGSSNRVTAVASDGRVMSAAMQVKEMLDEISTNNKMTAAIVADLQDVAKCKSEMRLGYPLLMKVNPNLTYKDQASFAGKKRYGKRIVQYCGQDFYVTNHIFVNNVPRIRAYFESLGLIKSNGTTTISPGKAKQQAIQDLIKQKVTSSTPMISTNTSTSTNSTDASTNTAINVNIAQKV